MYCGNEFPDGMRKNERLAVNVVTPTTKAVDHDEPISAAEIVDRGLMSQADWDTVRRQSPACSVSVCMVSKIRAQ